MQPHSRLSSTSHLLSYIVELVDTGCLCPLPSTCLAGNKPSANVCGWTNQWRPGNVPGLPAWWLVFQETQLLLAEGCLMLGASSRAFFILHNGLFFSCILLICLSDEIYYLLDFCNSFVPKSTVGYVKTPRQQQGRPEQRKLSMGDGDEDWKMQARKDLQSRVIIFREVAARSGSWEPVSVLDSAQPPSSPGLSDSLTGEAVWKALWKDKSILQMQSNIIPLSLININIIHSEAGSISYPGKWGGKFRVSIFLH